MKRKPITSKAAAEPSTAIAALGEIEQNKDRRWHRLKDNGEISSRPLKEKKYCCQDMRHIFLTQPWKYNTTNDKFHSRATLKQS